MHPLNSERFFGTSGIAAQFYNGSATVPGYVVKQRSQFHFDITDGTNLKKNLQLAPTTTIASAINSSNSAYFTIPVYPFNSTATGASFTLHYGVYAATIVAGGAGSSAGYAPADVLTLTGTGSAHVTVNTVDGGGGILTYSVTAPGTVTALPSNPVATTGGTGTGATFSLTWYVLSITSSGGTGYAINDYLHFVGMTAATFPLAYISTATAGAATATTVTTGGTGITVAATSITVSGPLEYVERINEFRLSTTEGNDYQWSLGSNNENSARIHKYSTLA